MADSDPMVAILDDLVEILRLQAKELEKLVIHVAQVTTRLPEASEMSVITSSLSAVALRVKKLRGGQQPGQK